MKTVKITCTIENPQRIDAGTVVTVPDELANTWLENDMAIEVKDEPTTDAPPPKLKLNKKITVDSSESIQSNRSD